MYRDLATKLTVHRCLSGQVSFHRLLVEVSPLPGVQNTGVGGWLITARPRKWWTHIAVYDTRHRD